MNMYNATTMRAETIPVPAGVACLSLVISYSLICTKCGSCVHLVLNNVTRSYETILSTGRLPSS